MNFKKDTVLIAKKIFAPNLFKMEFINGSIIHDHITLFARFKCQNCGLYSRSLLCPSLLTLTYKQFESIDSCRFFYKNNVKEAVIFVFKNDGTILWKRDKNELAHITFKKRFGRQLKGVENGSAKEINKQMKKLQIRMNKIGYNTQSLIAGHCDICPGSHRCPNRENPPCKNKGMPSLEATGIDVYKLLRTLEIPYQYPCLSELTQVTLLLNKKPIILNKED